MGMVRYRVNAGITRTEPLSLFVVDCLPAQPTHPVFGCVIRGDPATPDESS